MAESPVVKARIGLLMATRNQAALLPVALDSLLGQSHRQLTLTVVNDGSDDNTLEILARYQHDPRLTVVTTRPQGQVPGLNLAMQKGKPAAYYAVVYGSCFYAFNFLESMLDGLMRYPRSAGTFCCSCLGDAHQTGKIFQEPSYDANELLVRNSLGMGVMFRASSFKSAGGLFLSERKGIWETWQRLAQQGPFLKVPSILMRWQPSAYDMGPQAPAIDPEKDLYPHLKVRALVNPSDRIDPDWLALLTEAGHTLVLPDLIQERPQLVVCGSIETLPLALRQAYDHYAPLMYVVNEPEQLQALTNNPQTRFMFAASTLATRTLKSAQQIKAHGQQALVYMHGMTKRETNRLLTRVPMLLYRHKAVIVIRAYGHPRGLQRTLQALQAMNHPPDFAELVILALDRHPALLEWLKTQPYNWHLAQNNAYFPELLFLLRQFKGSYVLSLDAGIVPAADFFTRLWPLLTDPVAGMASGFINGAPGSQALPMHAKHPGELMRQWRQYKPKRPFDIVDTLSDSAFLIRKTVMEWALEAYPDTLPLANEGQFSRLLSKAGFHPVLSRQTVAFNLLYTL